ncbi:MAG: hypothetical protein WC342_05060 [Methanoregula sp.]|jgi:alanyl-tRNA synthetase
MDQEKKQKIEHMFAEEGITNAITCSRAFDLSGKYGIPMEEIGKFCNTRGIKIHGCQLGCFR